MKKDEMQLHDSEYVQRMSDASTAEGDGFLREAIRLARSAWPHIDGMLQFDRRYRGRQHHSVAAVDIVIRCAPVLLDFRALAAVGNLLADCKRIERETMSYAAVFGDAVTRLGDGHKLWSYLHRNGEVMQSELRARLGGDQDGWRAVADGWAELGLLARVPRQNSYLLSLATRLGQVVPARCPACGQTAEAPKSMFFESVRCFACGVEDYFVIGSGAK